MKLEGDLPVNEMVKVEKGTFSNGISKITLSSFYIGKYLVTQKEWRSITGNNPSRFRGDKLPVENVSWYDAIVFCNQLSQKEGLNLTYTINGEEISCDWQAKGYRLPTEAEWEYAARGGKLSKGYKFSGSDVIDEVAWYNKNSENKTHLVGLKVPNELGIYDMSGNVWEWCWDWYNDYLSSAQTNPKGQSRKSNSRVNRGGSWNSYGGCGCVVSHRDSSGPEYKHINLGFRIVLTI